MLRFHDHFNFIELESYLIELFSTFKILSIANSPHSLVTHVFYFEKKKGFLSSSPPNGNND